MDYITSRVRPADRYRWPAPPGTYQCIYPIPGKIVQANLNFRSSITFFLHNTLTSTQHHLLNSGACYDNVDSSLDLPVLYQHSASVIPVSFMYHKNILIAKGFNTLSNSSPMMILLVLYAERTAPFAHADVFRFRISSHRQTNRMYRRWVGRPAEPH